MKKVVVIGGGTGTSMVLSSLKALKGVDLSAIVSVADSGGSTGRLRDEFGFQPVGDLMRIPTYKDLIRKNPDNINLGLLTYPVLMAADILLYQADRVPVGKDQKQHLEIARDIALKFNNAYGDTFTLPEPLIREEVAVVPGTDGQKMSKSYGNTIALFGDEKAAKKAIMGIVTDSKGMSDPKAPDTCVLYQIHKLFLSSAGQKTLADEYRAGLPYGEGKKRLLAAYLDFFSPMRKKREEFAKKPDLVRSILTEGAAKAAAIAEETMGKVRSAVGLA